MTPAKMRLLPFLLMGLLCTTCRKGEEDPALSLRSRKARLCGEWKIVSGEVNYTYIGVVGYNETYSLKETGFEMNSTESGRPTAYTGKYHFYLTIKKDGTFTVNELVQGSVLDASGQWTFSAGKDGYKKKECVVFEITKLSSGDPLRSFFNRGQMSFRYSIVGLRDKEISIHSEGIIYKNENGDHANWHTDYKLASNE